MRGVSFGWCHFPLCKPTFDDRSCASQPLMIVVLSMLETEQVQMGDYASNLGYRFYPNALCLEVSCHRILLALGVLTGQGLHCMFQGLHSIDALAGVRLCCVYLPGLD